MLQFRSLVLEQARLAIFLVDLGAIVMPPSMVSNLFAEKLEKNSNYVDTRVVR